VRQPARVLFKNASFCILLSLFLNKAQYYACMSNLNSKSIEELQQLLGQRLNALRLLKEIDQGTTAERAGLSIRTIQYMEEGHGATIGTLLRVLKALDALDGMELLAPRPDGKPLPLPRGPNAKERLRLRSERIKKLAARKAAKSKAEAGQDSGAASKP
jgi:transcriptional regulator with XRE-family HTH domain